MRSAIVYVLGGCFWFLTTAPLAWCQSDSQPTDISPESRWYKGNLHTHSLWSDGDQFPEMIATWYRDQGYHFLALTDHNVLSQGIRWMPMKEVIKRSDPKILNRYRQRFGDAWVQTRVDPKNGEEVRLKPLNEFRCLVEEAGEFLLIPAEEISDKSNGKPIHINGTNLVEAIEPVGGKTPQEAMNNNLRAILDHGERHGREVLPHVNHPNFHYALSAEDLAMIHFERFFEVYNGHPGINHLGDDEHPSIERMWDLANAIRRTSLDLPPLMGVATDDSHEYHGQPGSRPGRGWVMVRCQYLTPEFIIRAMKRGDYYASSGVSLREIQYDPASKTLSLEIDATSDATYRTDFIATLGMDGDQWDADRIGVVVASSTDVRPSYALKGNELYVRAVVTSDQPHRDPSFDNQKQQAWTQPVGWKSDK